MGNTLQKVNSSLGVDFEGKLLISLGMLCARPKRQWNLGCLLQVTLSLLCPHHHWLCRQWPVFFTYSLILGGISGVQSVDFLLEDSHQPHGNCLLHNRHMEITMPFIISALIASHLQLSSSVNKREFSSNSVEIKL